MKLEEFREELELLGFTLTRMPDHFNGKYAYAMLDCNRLEIVSVKINPLNLSVEIENKDKVIVFGLGDLGLLPALDDIVHRVTGELVSYNEEDLKTARLIKEVKTLRLKPEDRLLLVVKSSVDKKSLDRLHHLVLNWLGERVSNKILITTEDVEFSKVSKDNNPAEASKDDNS